ncbi:MAG: SPOR domain-containing protein [Proteobacteria bacterium]|nr:SPOR domain-containing protein [Pseudomonadota bacterium]
MDKALKQRLTGAIILIALAIIFLPMLLDGERQQQQKSRIELPQQPVVNFPTRRLPIGQHQSSPQSSVTGPVNETVPAGTELIPAPMGENPGEPDKGEGVVIVPLNSATRQSAEIVTDSQAEETTRPAGETAPDQLASVEPEASMAAEPSALPATGGQWKLQVASFAGQGNAEKLMARLRRTGYQANIDVLKRNKTTLYRVLVQGYPDRNAASFAAQSISKQIEGVNPTVIPPESMTDDPAVDTAVANPGTRWVVQVGSFGQPENAEKLVQQLQKQGYTAYRQQSGSIHKVLVGPMISRDKAVRQRDEIFQKNKIKGMVKES